MRYTYRVSVREDHKDGLRATLEWFLRRATWDGNGRYSIQSVTADDIGARHTLIAGVESDFDIPHQLKQRIVIDGLAGWYRSSRDPADLQAFEHALREAARALEERSEPFIVITLWNVGLPADKLTFEANGLRTTVSDWSQVQGFPLDEVWNRAVRFWYSGPPRWLFQDGDYWLPITALVPGITEVQAPDWFSALELVSRSHDLVRAVLNLPLGIGFSLRWSRLPSPLGDFLPSPIWAVFTKDRKLADVGYSLELLHDIKRADLPDVHVTAAQELLQQIDAKALNQSIARFKSTLLRLYQAALDSTDRQSQFLSFWQVIEAATVTEPGTRDHVESRLITLLRLEPASINSHVVRAMASLRHDLVHRGAYPVDDLELPLILKWIAHRALYRAFALIEGLGGVNEMRVYFQLTNRGTTDLERLMRVAEYILHSTQRNDPHTM
jgi:hypothetical protein